MKQIEDFAIYALRLSDDMDFLYNTLNYAKADEGVMALYADQVQALSDAYQKMFVISQRHRGNLLTPEIQTSDQWRDSIYSMFSNICRLEKNNPDPAKKKAAEELEFAMKGYKGINDKSYTSQSSDLRSMCADLQGFHAAALETLGLTALLQQLVDANDNFERVINERRETLVGRENGEMAAARTEAEATYRVLILVVNAGTYSGNYERTAAFIGRQNVLISEFRPKVGQSTGTPDAKPEENPEQTPGETPEENPEQKPEDNEGTGSDNGNQGGSGDNGGNNGGYPPGYDPDADEDPGV